MFKIPKMFPVPHTQNSRLIYVYMKYSALILLASCTFYACLMFP